MAGIFELKTTAAGKFHFVLKAANGEVILSSEEYEAKEGAENGIAAVRTNAPDDARYERKTSIRGEPYFVLKAANGEIIGQSEMYTAEAGRENGIASVKTNAPGATFKDVSGAPKKAAAKKTAKKAATKKAAPEKTTAKKTAPKKTTAKAGAEKKTATKKATTKKAATKKAATKKAAPKKAAPKKTAAPKPGE
jgi:uncharacterized protein YegP (UPF0339 family)